MRVGGPGHERPPAVDVELQVVVRRALRCLPGEHRRGRANGAAAERPQRDERREVDHLARRLGREVAGVVEGEQRQVGRLPRLQLDLGRRAQTVVDRAPVARLRRSVREVEDDDDAIEVGSQRRRPAQRVGDGSRRHLGLLGLGLRELQLGRRERRGPVEDHDAGHGADESDVAGPVAREHAVRPGAARDGGVGAGRSDGCADRRAAVGGRRRHGAARATHDVARDAGEPIGRDRPVELHVVTRQELRRRGAAAGRRRPVDDDLEGRREHARVGIEREHGVVVGALRGGGVRVRRLRTGRAVETAPVAIDVVVLHAERDRGRPGERRRPRGRRRRRQAARRAHRRRVRENGGRVRGDRGVARAVVRRHAVGQRRVIGRAQVGLREARDLRQRHRGGAVDRASHDVVVDPDRVVSGRPDQGRRACDRRRRREDRREVRDRVVDGDGDRQLS